jgi:hypothetical protein
MTEKESYLILGDEVNDLLHGETPEDVFKILVGLLQMYLARIPKKYRTAIFRQIERLEESLPEVNEE